MKKFFVGVLGFVCLSGMVFAQDKPAAVVYDLTTKDVKKVTSTLFGGITGTANYYSSELRELKVAVVVHGGAYRYFLKDPYHSRYNGDSELIANAGKVAKMVKTLSEIYNVEFYVCAAGIRKREIQPIELYEFVKVVPNAQIPLIEKQNSGYAYVPVGD